jgi:hypothetical protein
MYTINTGQYQQQEEVNTAHVMVLQTVIEGVARVLSQFVSYNYLNHLAGPYYDSSINIQKLPVLSLLLSHPIVGHAEPVKRRNDMN